MCPLHTANSSLLVLLRFYSNLKAVTGQERFATGEMCPFVSMEVSEDGVSPLPLVPVVKHCLLLLTDCDRQSSLLGILTRNVCPRSSQI